MVKKANQQTVILKQIRSKEDRTVNIILAILLFISVVGWVMDEGADNEALDLRDYQIKEYEYYLWGSETELGLIPQLAQQNADLAQCRRQLTNDKTH